MDDGVLDANMEEAKGSEELRALIGLPNYVLVLVTLLGRLMLVSCWAFYDLSLAFLTRRS